jgi:hypothetical protein
MKKKEIYWLDHLIELVVVFLGVTASFVLLNVGNSKNERAMESKYIEGFRSDISENIIQLRDQIEGDSAWIENNTYAVHAILEGRLSSDSANSIVQGMAYFSRFAPQNTTYLNLINSGNLGIIQDYNLRQDLIGYHKKLDDSGLLEDYFHDYSTRNFIPFMMKNYSMYTRKLIKADAYRSPEFENLFGSYYSFKQQRLDNYLELLEHSNQLKKLLE